MIDAGNAGRIVNNASIAGLSGSFAPLGYTPYSVTKAALIHMTKCAALEYIPENIRINAVAPSVVETPLVTSAVEAATDPLQLADLYRFNPMGLHHGTLLQYSDVSGVISFLVGPDAKYINGQTIAVDGGFTIQ